MTGADAESALSVETSDRVATVFLNRPEKRNAMNMEFFAQLPTVMGALSSDRSVRSVVLGARGPHFCVGLDLNALSDLGALSDREGPSVAETTRRINREILRLQASISSVAQCAKPVVAAVHGYCLGGGVDLVAACDIRVCSKDAVFSVRETKMAMVPDIGSLARLPAILSAGHLAELVLTGRDVEADEACRIGLVNRVFDDKAACLEGARALAAEIAANSPLAVEGAKAVLAEGRRAEIEAGQRYVAAFNAGQLRSEDLKEAVTAFFEKRPPEFEGR